MTARPLAIALGACLALRVIGSALGSNWAWGLDTFRWWPLRWAAVMVALGAAGFVPPVARAIEAALERHGGAWQRHRWHGDVLAAGAVASIVLFARDPVRFVGDFRLRVAALAVGAPIDRLFPQAYPLDVFLNLRLPRMLAATGMGPALGLQLVGAVMAFAFALAALAFLRGAGARGGALAASACVLLGGGYVVHFAGYDKYGPLLLGTVLAAAGVVRLDSGKGGAWLVGAGAATAMLASRLGYALLPPALLALALAWRRREGRVSVAAAFTLAAITALALLPRTLAIARELDLATHVPGGAVARSLQSPDAPDPLMRVTDALNLLFLLVPIWPAALVLLARLRPAPRPTARIAGPAAALALALQLAMLLVFRARQGVARDWDAYTGVALTVGLVLVALLVAWWRESGGLHGAAAAVTVSLATATAFWGLHVSEAMALRRIGAALDGRPGWSMTARVAALDQLGLRALNLERYGEAARRFDAAGVLVPNPRFFYQAGLAYLRESQLDPAWTAFARAAALDHYAADPWRGMAEVSLARGDTTGAAALLDTALTRDPRDPFVLQARGALPPRFRRP